MAGPAPVVEVQQAVLRVVFAHELAALRDPLLLHLEQVREVDPARQADPKANRLGPVRLDPDPLPEPLTDEPVSGDRERALRDPLERRIRHVERSAVVVDAARGEDRRGPLPDSQDEAVEVASVLVEEAGDRPFADVATTV